MDSDAALTRAWDLGMDDGWRDAVMDEAEALFPVLLAAGYAATDDGGRTWWFTKDGVTRARELKASSERA
jgi:hypothetical protein